MDIVTFLLQPHGAIPNNPRLPVIVYRAAVSGMHDLAAAFEAEFDSNGWTHSWRNGVFDYHHYHSHAHEVLGIARGHARLAIGGPGARELNVQQGDCFRLAPDIANWARATISWSWGPTRPASMPISRRSHLPKKTSLRSPPVLYRARTLSAPASMRSIGSGGSRWLCLRLQAYRWISPIDFTDIKLGHSPAITECVKT